MLLTCTEEEYPGYKRQTFECSVCGGTMTQWAAVSSASNSSSRRGTTGKKVILFPQWLRRNLRKGNGGLKGVTAVFALPQMAYAAIINMF